MEVGRGEGGRGRKEVAELGMTSGIIGLCCSRERTGQAAAEAWCSGSWCSLCRGHGGRLGRCTPWLEMTAAGKSTRESERQRRDRERWAGLDNG